MTGKSFHSKQKRSQNPATRETNFRSGFAIAADTTSKVAEKMSKVFILLQMPQAVILHAAILASRDYLLLYNEGNAARQP
jgi:hypothetical protein